MPFLNFQILEDGQANRLDPLLYCIELFSHFDVDLTFITWQQHWRSYYYYYYYHYYYTILIALFLYLSSLHYHQLYYLSQIEKTTTI